MHLGDSRAHLEGGLRSIIFKFSRYSNSHFEINAVYSLRVRISDMFSLN